MTMFFSCHSHERGNPGGDMCNSLSLGWERARVRVRLPPPSNSLPPGEGEWVDSRFRGNDMVWGGSRTTPAM